MTGRSFESSVIDPKLFDAFFYITIALYLRVFGYVEDTAGWVLSISALVVMIVSWHRWEKAPQDSPVTAVVFTLACTVGFILIGNLLGLALLWLALTQLIFSLNSQWAWSYVAILSSITFVLHAIVGEDLLRGIWESTALALLMAVGLNFAQLLQRAVKLDQERAGAYLKLQRQLEQSQDLAISQERARIANTLHDGLGHKLTAVCMSLDYVGKTIATRPERATQETQVARSLTSEAIDDMRKVVRAMNPIAIDNNPLTTVSALAESFASTNLDVRFHSDVASLPEDQALLVLRFAQEALTNVVRHSDATRVHMRLRSGDPIEFEIRDNGNFAGQITPGFGIRSLSERASELGASLNYSVDNGFTISLSLPAAEVTV
ncbi:histidine kinase [Corynebacterium sp. H127]|uniref:sensor histidine kinase n=1 Tax=Corynebacterium sp. H127 TaxID=3133418 RepID=UPI0030AE3869